MKKLTKFAREARYSHNIYISDIRFVVSLCGRAFVAERGFVNGLQRDNKALYCCYCLLTGVLETRQKFLQKWREHVMIKIYFTFGFAYSLTIGLNMKI